MTESTANSEFAVDLFVIGGGSGGVRAARVAAQHGARVMLAEESRLGGTCVIRGCVPKKLYVYASRFADSFADAAGFGWTLSGTGHNFASLKASKDREIARLEQVYASNLQRVGVQSFAGRATLQAPQCVRLSDGRLITAKYVLIATGGQPSRPAGVPGIELTETSNDVFEWTTLPKQVLIVGGGYIGVEFACLLKRLGCAVTLIVRGEAILPRFDEDLRTELTVAMRAAGITVRTGTDVLAIRGQRGALAVQLSATDELQCECVLYATGRKPNTDGLGLAAVGALLDKSGGLIVDEFSKSNLRWLYAVGDVTNRVQLTPVAIREGHAFADTVFGNEPTPVDLGPIPTAVFSTPELGTVGLTEAQARSAHGDVKIFKTSFRAMKATLSGSSERVLMKLVVDPVSDRVLGVHILGEGAGEMIQLVAIAVRMGATKRDLDRTLAVHPTAAEELVTMRTLWQQPLANKGSQTS
jgi:glutathione reductase (NADPH)